MIEGIPEGWELVRVGKPVRDIDWVIDPDGKPKLCDYDPMHHNRPIVRRIEKPKQYRPFANAAEYVAHIREGFAVDWKVDGVSRGFHAVVSANDHFVFVAFREVVKRFNWAEAFENLVFRHIDNTTSPFGVEVQS